MSSLQLTGSAKKQDFSLSFLIYLVITFLVHLYSNTGKNAAAQVQIDSSNASENGYAKLHNGGRLRTSSEEDEGPEAYELAEQDGEEDAVKIGTEDEVDWMNGGPRRAGGQNAVRL